MKVTPMKGTGGTPGYRRNPHHSLHTRRTQDRPPAPGKRQAAAVTVNFSFLYTNVASLMSKFSQLLVEVDSKAPTVIVITETWLHDRIPDSYVNIPGYNLFRRFRPDDPHGGVPIYVLNFISGMNIATAPLTQLMEPSLEALWVKLVIADATLVVGAVYRPPTGTTRTTPEDALLCEVLRRTETLDATLLVFGDFNFPKMKWQDGLPCGSTSAGKKFAEALADTTLVQLVQEPTRHKDGHTPSLLDLVLTNKSLLVTTPALHPGIGNSDHLVITTAIELVCHPTRTLPASEDRTSFFKLDYDGVRLGLPEILPPQTADLIGLYDSMANGILSVARSTAPPRPPRRRKVQKPWISADILRSIRRKDRLWETYRKSNSPTIYQRYRAHCNAITNTIREARKSYESNVIVHFSNEDWPGTVDHEDRHQRSRLSLKALFSDHCCLSCFRSICMC